MVLELTDLNRFIACDPLVLSLLKHSALQQALYLEVKYHEGKIKKDFSVWPNLTYISLLSRLFCVPGGKTIRYHWKPLAWHFCCLTSPESLLSKWIGVGEGERDCLWTETLEYFDSTAELQPKLYMGTITVSWGDSWLQVDLIVSTASLALTSRSMPENTAIMSGNISFCFLLFTQTTKLPQNKSTWQVGRWLSGFELVDGVLDNNDSCYSVLWNLGL